MMRRTNGSVKGLALFTTGLIIALGAAVPMLEAGILSDEMVFEAEHASGCYLPDHDHSICVQLAQLRWLKTSSVPLDPPPLSSLEACASSVTPPELLQREVRQDSRAPPLV